jgi:hypothetical protein
MTVTLEGTATAPANAGHPLGESPLPYWLSEPCPAWCASLPHTNQDTGLIRAHRSGGYSVLLTLESAAELYDSGDPDVTGYAPKCIDLDMGQHYREAEPHLHLIFACDGEPDLTLAEGATLAVVLTSMADSAGDMAAEAEDRPFWLAGSCPAWCTASHSDGDDPDDWRHVGEYRWVPLTVEDPYVAFPSEAATGPGANWQAPQISVVLERDWREIEAHIVIEYDNDKYLSLTLAEARELAGAVTELLAAAR